MGCLCSQPDLSGRKLFFVAFRNIFYFFHLCRIGGDCQVSVDTGEFQRRIVAEKGVSSPLFFILHAFKHVAVAADALQDFQCFYWCTDIRINFSAYRDFPKSSRCGYF